MFTNMNFLPQVLVKSSLAMVLYVAQIASALQLFGKQHTAQILSND